MVVEGVITSKATTSGVGGIRDATVGSMDHCVVWERLLVNLILILMLDEVKYSFTRFTRREQRLKGL